MSGRGPIYEWDVYTTGILKRILNHMRKLQNFGFEQDEDLLYSIEEEIRRRKK